MQEIRLSFATHIHYITILGRHATVQRSNQTNPPPRPATIHTKHCRSHTAQINNSQDQTDQRNLYLPCTLRIHPPSHATAGHLSFHICRCCSPRNQTTAKTRNSHIHCIVQRPVYFPPPFCRSTTNTADVGSKYILQETAVAAVLMVPTQRLRPGQASPGKPPHPPEQPRQRR